MQLYKIHKFYVVADSLEQAKEAVKDRLPETYFSESVCPVHVIAVEQPLAPDGACTCDLQSEIVSTIHETTCPLFYTPRR